MGPRGSLLWDLSFLGAVGLCGDLGVLQGDLYPPHPQGCSERISRVGGGSCIFTKIGNIFTIKMF